MGNADGSLWTDLLHLTQRPAPSRALERYERDGRSRLAVAVPYTGNPLVIAAELPEDAVLAPLRRLARELAAIAALIVAVGFGLGWWFSRDVSAPVARLTHAAEGIAGGDLTHVNVAMDRGDEIGRLSRAFAVMADHVRGTQDTLERQVAERTKALHEAQDELVKKERLAILGQLSSGVGHELRNPLGVMTNAVYFLEMTLPDAPKKAKDYLGILRAQIRLSEKIVSDLLDFARVKSPQRAIVPLAQLLEEPLGRVTVPEGVRVERDVPGGLPGAFVDQVQVGQVLLNLVTNAVQAMEETGGVLSLRASGRNGRVRLEVGDSGPGIAPENLTRIFEPLFTTKARGIGLGLSVSRLLAEANNGVLTARSEPGHGATFVLDLPAAQG
jgi:signal transduction histidine kinase